MTEPASLVRTDSDAAVRILTLNYPAKRNALSLDLRAALYDAVAAALADDSIRALVLTGAAGCFCAGGDLSSIQNVGGGAGRERLGNLHMLVRLLAARPNPLVAVVGDGRSGGWVRDVVGS